MTEQKPIVLVLCTGNSARSQMAEAFLRKYHGDRVDARSAGTDPAPRVNPLAVRAMQEIGINIATARPKDLTEFLNNPRVRDVLIVCDNANQTCPRSWRGDFRTFMPFDDPAAARGTEDEQLAVFRRIRDEIGRAMREWKPTPESATR
jgi:arsenate reductase